MNIKKNSKNNTYYFSISLGFDAVTGKRRQTMRSGFRTKKDAEKEFNRLKHLNFEGQYQQVRRIPLSFKTLIEIYAKERKDKVKTTTHNNEQGHIANHVLPYFKDVNIHKITRNTILDYRDYLKTKSISNNTINKIMLSVKMLLDTAVINGYLTVSPYQNIKQLKVEKPKMNFWTPQEFQQFIQSVAKNESFTCQLFFTFAYLTGARLSEILACRWEDINFFTQTWRVSKSLNYDKVNYQYYLDTPKTSSSLRSIGLPQKLVDMLKEHQQKHDWEFVFSQSIGTFNSRYFDRIFKKHIKLANVQPIRFHDLRHSHVALLIHMEEQDFIIKERMGHSSIKITYDIYGHLFPTRQKELADKLNDII